MVGESGVVVIGCPFGELAELAEAVVAPGGECLGFDAPELSDLVKDPLLEVFGGLLWVAVRTADGLFDDRFDDPELLVVLGGEVEGGGGGVVVLFVGLFPEDGGASLGTDDGVPGVLHHGDAVGNSDAQGATRTALPNDHGDDGCLEACHVSEIDGDRFGLPALLCPDARVGARGVDEGDDGKPELLGELHFEECLAIALGVCTSEVARELLLGVAPLVVPDDEALDGADAAESCDDGGVFAVATVAVEFAEVLADQGDVIACLGTSRVACNADGIPGREIGVEAAEELRVLLAEGGGVLVVWEVGGALATVECIDLGLEAVEGLLEFECVGECHGVREDRSPSDGGRKSGVGGSVRGMDFHVRALTRGSRDDMQGERLGEWRRRW